MPYWGCLIEATSLRLPHRGCLFEAGLLKLAHWGLLIEVAFWGFLIEAVLLRLLYWSLLIRLPHWDCLNSSSLWLCYWRCLIELISLSDWGHLIKFACPHWALLIETFPVRFLSYLGCFIKDLSLRLTEAASFLPHHWCCLIEAVYGGYLNHWYCLTYWCCVTYLCYIFENWGHFTNLFSYLIQP